MKRTARVRELVATAAAPGTTTAPRDPNANATQRPLPPAMRRELVEALADLLVADLTRSEQRR